MIQHNPVQIFSSLKSYLNLLPNFSNQIKRPCKYFDQNYFCASELSIFSYDHVDKLVHNATIDGDAWQPLINYRRILNDEPGGGHGAKPRTSTANRGRKRAAPQDGKCHTAYELF